MPSCENGRQQRCFIFGRLAIALMREAFGEACPAIDLEQKVGDCDAR
jgi:hypothetical protein